MANESVNEEQLAEWERMAAEATPGPWVWWKYGLRSAVTIDAGMPRGPYVLHDHEDGVQEGAEHAADLDFIAAARAMVPALIAEVRRLQAARSHDTATALRRRLQEALAEVERLRAKVAEARELREIERGHARDSKRTPF